MNTKGKLICLAVLATLSGFAYADVYKCDVGGTISYQQSPCSTGNKKEMIVKVKPNSATPAESGLRSSEVNLLKSIADREVAESKAKLDAEKVAQENALAERRHKELIDATMASGIMANPHTRINPNVMGANPSELTLTPVRR